ncbi:MAG TPA: GNAT family N-acetyltransferase [Baekduia sp.]|nr:GNAT family N-acetyltransferase [Baekduia sp.]
MRVRPAVRGDIPEIARLVVAAQATHRDWAGDVPQRPEAEEELEWDLRFARASAWIAVAEDDDGSIAGAVAFAQATVSREDRTPVRGLAHVSAVFVRPDRFRRGVARTMLEAAEAAMRDAGFDRAQLFTLEGSPAERLYTALGWQRDGRREPYPPMDVQVVAYVKAL